MARAIYFENTCQKWTRMFVQGLSTLQNVSQINASNDN